MKRLMLYTASAAVLGLLLTLVPAVIFAETKVDSHFSPISPEAVFLNQFHDFRDKYSLPQPKSSVADLQILAVSFAVALIAYFLLKRRRTHLVHRWAYPY